MTLSPSTRKALLVGTAVVLVLGLSATILVDRASSSPPSVAKINAALEQQSQALLHGDEKGFLRPAKSGEVRAKLKMRFRNLTAMRVTRATMKTVYGTDLEVSVCFVVPDCVLDKVTETAQWADRIGGPELVSLEPPERKDLNDHDWYGGPRPWELTDLVAAHGERVLVAAPKALVDRLPAVAAAAEAAARVADTFVGRRTRPELYRIYLADDETWELWYGDALPEWQAAYTKAIGPTHTDVVILDSSVRASFLPELLRHELTHAATMQGYVQWHKRWWLIEGIADLAGQPSEGINEAFRDFIRTRWDGKLPENGPPEDATEEEAEWRYSVAFLAVKRIEERFGRERLLAFFDRLTTYGEPKEIVSQNVFGVPWDNVNADCIATIRRA